MRKDVVIDLTAVVGVTAVLWGVGLIYFPLAMIVGGGTIVGVCVVLARRLPHHR